MKKIEKETGITTAEASEYLGCSAYTLRQLCREKKIKHYRINSKIMFTNLGLESFVREQEEKNYKSDEN